MGWKWFCDDQMYQRSRLFPPRWSSCKQWSGCPPTTPASPSRRPGSLTSPGSSQTSPAEPVGSIQPAGPSKRTTTRTGRRTNPWRMWFRTQPFNHMTLKLLFPSAIYLNIQKGGSWDRFCVRDTFLTQRVKSCSLNCSTLFESNVL